MGGGLGSRGGVLVGSARGHCRPRPQGCRSTPQAARPLRVHRSVRGVGASARAARSAPLGLPACLCPRVPWRSPGTDGGGESAVK